MSRRLPQEPPLKPRDTKGGDRMTPEQRERRIYHHLYETCEGIAQQTERIVKLEELVAELYPMASDLCDTLSSCTSCRMWGDDGCLLNGVQDRIMELEVPL